MEEFIKIFETRDDYVEHVHKNGSRVGGIYGYPEGDCWKFVLNTITADKSKQGIVQYILGYVLCDVSGLKAVGADLSVDYETTYKTHKTDTDRYSIDISYREYGEEHGETYELEKPIFVQFSVSGMLQKCTVRISNDIVKKLEEYCSKEELCDWKQ